MPAGRSDMTVKEVLRDRDIYLITYRKTGKPYIDEGHTAHAFTGRREAEAFLSSDTLAAEFCEVSPPGRYGEEELFGRCYASGADSILLSGPDLYDIPLGHLPPTRYYNHRLAGTLNLLLTTRKKKYLFELYDRKFIVAVRIDRGTVINYGIARVKDREFFLAFSDTDEFSLWSSSVPGFSPLELTFREIQGLSLDRDIIINISGNRFLLDREKIERIDKERESETERPDKIPV